MFGKGSTGANIQPDDVASSAPNALAEIVVELIEIGGYDAVQLREVARRARMSLSTIYKRYATRDELIIAALTWWMDTYRYAAFTGSDSPLPQGESLHDGLMRVFRPLFAPWEQHPQLLKAYFRALNLPGGQRLTQHGLDIVVPVAKAAIARADPDFARDLELILEGVFYGLLSRLASGAIDVTDMVPALERVVYRLTCGYESSIRVTPFDGFDGVVDVDVDVDVDVES